MAALVAIQSCLKLRGINEQFNIEIVSLFCNHQSFISTPPIDLRKKSLIMLDGIDLEKGKGLTPTAQ